MIDEDRTLQLYGYTSDELSHTSEKPIIAVCEECGTYRISSVYAYRDICHACSARRTGRANKGKLCGDKNPNFGRCGDAHPMWKGGITPVMKKLWHSTVYKNWRKAVFERDDYTCQMCNTRGGKIGAHHIRPVRDHKNDLSLFDVDNGITLCLGCHRTVNQREGEYVAEFERMVIK